MHLCYPSFCRLDLKNAFEHCSMGEGMEEGEFSKAMEDMGVGYDIGRSF